MTRLNIVVITAILALTGVAQIAQKTINPDVVQPRVYHQRIPFTYGKKLLHQTYVYLVNDINFELNALLYVHNGEFSNSDDVYNTSKYGDFSSKCRIYKTDLKMKQYTEFNYASSPESNIIIERKKVQPNGKFATIYIAHQNDVVRVLDLSTVQIPEGSDLSSSILQQTNFKIRQVANFTVDAKDDEKINLVNIGGIAYVVTSSRMTKYNDESNSKDTVSGYQGNGRVLKVEQMENNTIYTQKRFYVLTSKDVSIYTMASSTQVKLNKTFSQFGTINLLTSQFDSGFLYISGYNKLFVIDLTDPRTSPISSFVINGSCYHMEKFQTTLHLSCTYDKLQYVAQFLAIGAQIYINRFYANQDIQGRAITRRIGLGKMGIVTDSDIRITGYALNRHALLQNDDQQPQFIFGLKYGFDLVPLKMATFPFMMSMVVFSGDRLAVLKIRQIPPQLYCEYPDDEPGAKYQVLMQFNTSRCSYVKEEEDLLYGNIQNVCDILVPVLIETKQVQFEAKHTNFIQILLIMLFLTLLLVIIGCGIKYNRVLEGRFLQLQRALEKAKSGYTKNKKGDI